MSIHAEIGGLADELYVTFPALVLSLRICRHDSKLARAGGCPSSRDLQETVKATALCLLQLRELRGSLGELATKVAVAYPEMDGQLKHVEPLPLVELDNADDATLASLKEELALIGAWAKRRGAVNA